TINSELARMGEPPLEPDEELLMTRLDAIVDEIRKKRARDEPVCLRKLLTDRPELVRDGAAILQVVEGLEALMSSVLEHSGILADHAMLTNAETEFYDASVRMPDPDPLKYRVRKFLGKGSFSRVWLADHLVFQMPVALKTLHFEVSGPERARALAA